MKNTSKKGRPKRKTGRSNISVVAFVVVLCFFSGAFTYAVLDKIFSKKDSPKIEKQENIKTQVITPKIDPKSKPIQEQKIVQQEIEKESIKENIKEDENLTGDKNASNLSGENLQFLIETKPEANLEPVVKNPPKRPKLAIIIDDVSTNEDIAGIKSIKYPLTPSIFPPTKLTPNTDKLSKKCSFYMIHLPTEAMKYNNVMPNTLRVGDNEQKIDSVIASVRASFPEAKFINNHTGSKFTNDKKSMDILLSSLKKYGFTFIDSRTIGSSKGKIAAKNNAMRYIYRDIFLDNENSVIYIKNQLREAVKIAKKRGYAIAIGHPKSATFAALRTSDEILKGVDVVYVSEIYEYYK